MVGGGIVVPGVDNGASDALALESFVQRKKSAELQNSPSLFKTNERSTRDDVGTGLRLAT